MISSQRVLYCVSYGVFLLYCSVGYAVVLTTSNVDDVDVTVFDDVTYHPSLKYHLTTGNHRDEKKKSNEKEVLAFITGSLDNVRPHETTPCDKIKKKQEITITRGDHFKHGTRV